MRFLACLALIYPSFLFAAESSDDAALPRPEVLLSLMSTALREKTYSGEFTYEHGSKLETFHIVHSVEEGQESERLYRLTGPEQEFVRSGIAACGTIGGHLLGGSRLTSSDGQYFGLDRYYRATLLGQDRIAGRYVWLLQLIPQDEYRFGITLAIDAESQLLMRYVIYDARKKIALERMQFVSLDVGVAEPPAAVDEEAQIAVAPHRCVGATYSPDGHSPWKPAWLPPGFILTGYSYSEEDGHMETYTDGVSWFSVFVRPSADDAQTLQGRIQQGVSSRGAVMALISALPGDDETLFVSVVGEIPLPAAQKVSLSIRKVAEAQGVMN